MNQPLPQPGRARWQLELARAYRDPRDLLRDLDLDPEPYVAGFAAGAPFPTLVPRPFVARMRSGDPDDPLLRQVLPVADEGRAAPGFVADPLAEQAGARPGLLHKYRSRVLVILRGGCAINCRYCFRRHFPYGDHALTRGALEEIVAYVGARPEVDEVILSGGDPLLTKDAELAAVVEALGELPQLRRLRIHTRLPITLPSRITPALVDLLGGAPWPTIVVFHTNHARELDAEVDGALRDLRGAGVTLLNQSVLLRGVNDSVEALAELSERLFEAGVLPYYLHLLDRVAGAAHFEVGEDEARALVAGLYRTLPGFLVPRLVREIAGEPSKVPIDLGLEPATR
jgi:EF-P beta-lysylation protein EpmB